jgi:serine/threonine protein kinase
LTFEIYFKDFVRLCLKKDPKERPTAYQLLFHPLLIELHTLKLLSAHRYLDHFAECDGTLEFILTGRLFFFFYKFQFFIKKEIHFERTINNYINNIKPIEDNKELNDRSDEHLSAISVNEYKYPIPKFIEDLNKFFGDVKSGLHPITAYLHKTIKQPNTFLSNFVASQLINSAGNSASGTQSPVVVEHKDDLQSEKRKAQNISLQITSDEKNENYTVIFSFVVRWLGGFLALSMFFVLISYS